MEPSRGECQALRPRPEREVCNPQIHLLHLPHHLSRLEARKTDNDNAKQQKRKIEDNSNCSQPLACAQASHPFVQLNRRGKGRLSAHPDGTIAVLDQTSAIFSLHNHVAGRGAYISYGRNLQTWDGLKWNISKCCAWSPDFLTETIFDGLSDGSSRICTPQDGIVLLGALIGSPSFNLSGIGLSTRCNRTHSCCSSFSLRDLSRSPSFCSATVRHSA